ncbi:uncharacterized protein E0L32_000470 [Thyridium curvatum]|uniref:Uncharacterized protein n=1 Tax=Thyridium curvatum TaxID=1093900 RepID=A0A507B4R2_9PEZI|nr:uncharacterized protein E0L32_000470 [Thyridium curvatum]TPX14076.1 hypothetical protein E0L32_000470 [Thyridium curvatum]
MSMSMIKVEKILVVVHGLLQPITQQALLLLFPLLDPLLPLQPILQPVPNNAAQQRNQTRHTGAPRKRHQAASQPHLHPRRHPLGTQQRHEPRARDRQPRRRKAQEPRGPDRGRPPAGRHDRRAQQEHRRGVVAVQDPGRLERHAPRRQRVRQGLQEGVEAPVLRVADARPGLRVEAQAARGGDERVRQRELAAREEAVDVVDVAQAAPVVLRRGILEAQGVEEPEELHAARPEEAAYLVVVVAVDHERARHADEEGRDEGQGAEGEAQEAQGDHGTPLCLRFADGHNLYRYSQDRDGQVLRCSSSGEDSLVAT